MPSSADSPRLDGSRAPAGRRPSRIASRSVRSSCSYSDCSLRRSSSTSRSTGPLNRPMNWNCTQGQLGRSVRPMTDITVIGGGLAGLTAAITCAEGGASVRLFEAHATLGGRARSTDGPYKANLRPAAISPGGVLGDCLPGRGLMPPLARPLLTGVRFHYDGAVHWAPPLSLIPPSLRLHGRMAPVDQDFRSW